MLATGTDQPVLTAALVSEKLNLPYFIGSPTALLVTNKKHMKKEFNKLGIPTSPFCFYGRHSAPGELENLSPPAGNKTFGFPGTEGGYEAGQKGTGSRKLLIKSSLSPGK